MWLLPVVWYEVEWLIACDMSDLSYVTHCLDMKLCLMKGGGRMIEGEGI